MSPELIEAVPLCRNLPTPMGVAMRIIALAKDPEADIASATDTIATDPALSARILRLANSPIFASRRKIENLPQAITKLGLHPTLQLALGFSLLSDLRGSYMLQAEHDRIWRRSLLCGLAARALGETLGLRKPEELLLAGLLQDIGALFLMQDQPELYLPLATTAGGNNTLLLQLECEHLQATHAEIGAELARHWNLPDYLVQAIAASEDPDEASSSQQRCIHLSGALADIWLSDDTDAAKEHAQHLLTQHLELPAEQLGQLLARMGELLPEASSLFETPIATPARVQALLEEAREIAQLRDIREAQAAEELRQRSNELERRALELSTMASRDSLTGVINRGHMEQALLSAYDTANKLGQPLSVAFIDLDDFKKINDQHGHLIGDDVLKGVARHLLDHVRTADLVARFGGEEFVILFPDTSLESAESTINRVLSLIKRKPMALVNDTPLFVTFSAGIACHGDTTRFPSARSLLDAADRALYQSKGEGRNRVACHQPTREEILDDQG